MLTNGSMNINPIHVGYALGAAVLAAMAFISLQELNKHNSPKNIRVLLSLIRLDFVAALFYCSMGNTNTTWIHITAFSGRIWSYFPIITHSRL